MKKIKFDEETKELGFWTLFLMVWCIFIEVYNAMNIISAFITGCIIGYGIILMLDFWRIKKLKTTNQ